MDRLKLIIINLFVPVSVSVFVFLAIYTNGFCSSLALSQGASQTLGNSLESMFDLSGVSVSPDPVGLSIGLSQIYDNLDLYLYQNYNYDLSGTVNDTLESGAPYINQDAVLQDNFVKTITNGLYNTMQELTGYGYAIYKAATMELHNVKDTFFIGKEENGVVTEILDNSVVYVNDDVLNAYSSSINDAISDDYLIEFSEKNHFLYGRNLHIVQDINHHVTIYFPNDIIICNYDNSSDIIWALVNSNSRVDWDINGIYVNGSETIPLYHAYTEISDMKGPVIIDGKNYYLQKLRITGTNYISYYVYSGAYNTNYRYGSYQQVFDTLNDKGGVSGTYSLSPDVESVIKALLNELNGHYVSTSDLDMIIDSLINNGIVSNDDVVIDNVTENVPVIDWSQDYIDTLEGIIETVLERSSVYDDVISDSNVVTPDPPINDNVNQGIDIPTGFNGDILTSFTNIVTLPTRFFTVFEPLFKILGNNPAILGLWLFFPVFLLIIFIIWALK